MSHPSHTPGHMPTVETTPKVETASPVSEKQGEVVGRHTDEIEKSLKAGGEFDEKMKKILPSPTKESVVAHFGKQENFKNKSYDEIMTELERDDALMAGWVKRNVSSPSSKEINTKEMAAKASDEETEKYLSERGYTEKVGIKPLDEKVSKTIEANKSPDISGFDVFSSVEKLKVGDIVIGQPLSKGGVKGENPIYRLDEKSKSEKRYLHVNYPGTYTGDERMQEMKRLFKWHEVTEKDIKTKPTEVKPDSSKIEVAKPEPQKIEVAKEEKSGSKPGKIKGFLKKIGKGTGNVIKRPFKKTRQATKRTGKKIGQGLKRPFGKSDPSKKGIHNTRIGRLVTRPVRKGRDIGSGVVSHARGTIKGGVKYQREGLKKAGRRLVKPLRKKSK